MRGGKEASSPPLETRAALTQGRRGRSCRSLQGVRRGRRAPGYILALLCRCDAAPGVSLDLIKADGAADGLAGGRLWTQGGREGAPPRTGIPLRLGSVRPSPRRSIPPAGITPPRAVASLYLLPGLTLFPMDSFHTAIPLSCSAVDFTTLRFLTVRSTLVMMTWLKLSHGFLMDNLWSQTTDHLLQTTYDLLHFP